MKGRGEEGPAEAGGRLVTEDEEAIGRQLPDGSAEVCREVAGDDYWLFFHAVDIAILLQI